jgi:hypothetical protein
VTRKDFEAIAQAIRDTFSADAREMAGVEPGPWAWMHRRAVRRMGDVLYATNGRFDRDRFESACEVTR